MSKSIIKKGDGMALWSWGRVFFLVMVVAFLALVLRSFGLYVTVIGDEYTYANLSRNVPFSESTVPGYIYLLVFGLTKFAGADFLEFGRVLNALLYVLGGGFVYLTATRFTNPALSFLIALLALLGPFSSYTVYYMPETMYFFGFWGMILYLVGASENKGGGFWVGAGALLGLISLIKPHALFAVPALLCYVIYISVVPGKRWLRSAVLNSMAFLLAAIFVKMAVGYILAGAHGLSILGGLYGSVVESTSSKITSYADTLGLVLVSLQGHALALVIMYSVPFAILSVAVVRFLSRGKGGGPTESLEVLTALIFLNLLAVVVIFSAFVSINGNGESITRLHMRYYNFIFPLLSLLVAARLSSAEENGGVRLHYFVGVLVAAAAAYSISEFFGVFTPGLVDSPEYRGYTFSLNSFYWLGGLSLVAVVLWIFNKRVGNGFFILLYFPVMTVVTSWFVNEDVRERLTPTVFDRAGLFAKHYIPESEVSELAVVGSDDTGLYKALFYLDNYNATARALLPGEAVKIRKVAAGKKWLLVIGNHGVRQDDTQFVVSMDGFKLYRLQTPIDLDFTNQAWKGSVSNVEGLSTGEGWGIWSLGKTVDFKFHGHLPRIMRVKLTAQAFGPNIGKEFVLKVGEASYPFTLGAYPEEKTFLIRNEGKVESIVLIVPAPISPKALGYGEDVRELGIGLVSMRIDPFESQ